MVDIEKKIREEERKIEQQIEEESFAYEKEIDELCEKDISYLKDEVKMMEEEIHQKSQDLEEDLKNNKKNNK
ncbi:MAG: hypothetical protein ACTSQI_13295 [Candidatus Helarchaeota archaeon]